MNELLWTGLLDHEVLQRHLAPPRGVMPFAIVESLKELIFPGSGEELDPANWSKGRIFGEAAELRWVSRPDGYRAWLVADNPLPGIEQELPHLHGTEWVDAWCYLWGESEGRIGWSPEYDAVDPGEGHLRLRRREFRRAGTLVYLRLVEMERERRA